MTSPLGTKEEVKTWKCLPHRVSATALVDKPTYGQPCMFRAVGRNTLVDVQLSVSAPALRLWAHKLDERIHVFTAQALGMPSGRSVAVLCHHICIDGWLAQIGSRQ